jgi:hypothetical protein
MKHVIIAVLGIVLLSCQQQPVTPTMTPLEQELVGTWNHDQNIIFTYTGDTASVIAPQCTGASITFTGDPHPQEGYDWIFIDDRLCSSAEYSWSRTDASSLTLVGAVYQIVTLTTNQLVIKTYSSSEHMYFSK